MLTIFNQTAKSVFTVLSLLSCFLSLNLNAQSNLTINFIDSVQTSCQNDAYATVEVSGGLEPYTVYWLTYGQTTPPGTSGQDTVAIGTTASDLAPGYYNIVAYDSSDPEQIVGYSSFFVQSPFQVNQSVTPATCSNADGILRINILNAAGPFDIEWSNGVIRNGLINPSDSIVNVAAGNYSILVTDQATGCFSAGSEQGSPTQGGLYVWSTSPVTATTAATPSNCFDGTASVVPANGTAPYSYLWNTEPAQTDSVASGLAPGFYYCTITDAEGCTRQQFVNVPAGPNFIQVTSSVNPSTCGNASGSVNLTVSGGVPPYSYTWSNGETVEDISGLLPGSYSVQIQDSEGCQVQVNKYVQNYSPLNVNISGAYSGCSPNGGSASVSVSGGMAPYTYTWNNGETADMINNLSTGYVSVIVEDANGCTGHDYFNLNLPQECYVQLRGRVFNDLNGNCIQDGGESGLPNVLVNASPGYHYATTNANGNYSITAEPGNYSIQVYSPNNWEQVCPEIPLEIEVDASMAGQTYNGNNFYLAPDSIFNDISVYVASGPVRPGFPVHWYAVVRNLGTTSLTPLLELEHDPLATYTGANPSVTSYSAANHKASWQTSPIPPLTNRNYYLYSTLSTSAVLGDSVRAVGTVTLGEGSSDVNPDNNTSYYARLITGSYDPNDKLATPRGEGEQGYIYPNDTTLHYRIRFQNTGTDTAFTVVIRDTLDAALDITSFRIDQASHPMEYEITGEGELTFTFNNILLPDSFVNEPASNGLVSYFINRKPDLPIGTEIRNTAAIYFDFNLPIYTNTTLNTLFDQTVSVEEIGTSDFTLKPNPAAHQTIIQLNLKSASDVHYQLSDISGRVIISERLGLLSKGTHEWAIAGLNPGVYLVIINEGQKVSSKRLIISGH